MGHTSVVQQPSPVRLAALTKARLATEIVLAYGRVRTLMRRPDLPRAVSRLRSTNRSPAKLPLSDIERDGRRLGAAVVRTLEALPFDSRCLMRSLVLLELLARRGATGSLVIAVRPSEELALAAHAWVELDGKPLLAPADQEHGRLVTL